MYAFTALKLKTVVSPTVLDAFPLTRQACVRGARGIGTIAVALVFFFTHNEICNTATRYCKPHGARSGALDSAWAHIVSKVSAFTTRLVQGQRLVLWLLSQQWIESRCCCCYSLSRFPSRSTYGFASIPYKHTCTGKGACEIAPNSDSDHSVPAKTSASADPSTFTGTVPEESSNQRSEC